MSWSSLVSSQAPARRSRSAACGGGSRLERHFAVAMALTTMLVGAAFALF